MADSKQDFTTVIGPDASFKGEISFESSAKVLGRVEGSIASKDRIHIADGSDCKATVTAKEIAVEGHIEGNCEASDRIEILANGRITGDVVAARMNMAEGASINGYCRIGVSGNGQARTSQTEVKPASGSATSDGSASGGSSSGGSSSGAGQAQKAQPAAAGKK